MKSWIPVCKETKPICKKNKEINKETVEVSEEDKEVSEEVEEISKDTKKPEYWKSLKVTTQVTMLNSHKLVLQSNSFRLSW